MEELRDWVLQARQGELESYGKIVRRFQDMAYGYAYSLLSDFHLAEDAAQEAFIEAFRDLADLRTPEAFPGWFRKIIFKQCDRIIRRKRPQGLSPEVEGRLPSREPEPGDIAAKKEMAESVLRAIRTLPEPERTVTTLFYINGYSQNDIADFLEVPATTVNNRLHSSRTRLKERMMNMVTHELRKNTLPEDFRQRVLTLAQIAAAGLGRVFLIHFSNGVRVRARVDEVIQGDVTGRTLALVCGPTDISLPNEPQGLRHLESYLLIPDSVVTICVAPEAEKPGLYERMGASAQAGPEPSYASAPVFRGPLEVLPEGFGFVRLGKRRHPYEYRNEKSEKHVNRAAPKDVFVSADLIQDHGLKTGDKVECTVRSPIGSERFRSAATLKRAL
ncbi:MAG: sigma-70 family RNA polymerase sigma factor [Candidatus Brocadiia bacterium]|jgi:RNA polymerase sigma factor (sigma-70 family)